MSGGQPPGAGVPATAAHAAKIGAEGRQPARSAKMRALVECAGGRDVGRCLAMPWLPLVGRTVGHSG